MKYRDGPFGQHGEISVVHRVGDKNKSEQQLLSIEDDDDVGTTPVQYSLTRKQQLLICKY